MDAVTLAAANANAAKRFSGRPAALIAKLARGKESAVLQVLGDSTGNDTNEWVYLTSQWLGTQYPGYQVRHYLWNDTSQNYDAPTTIQAGTAATPATVADTYTAADGTAVVTNSVTSSGHTYTLVGGAALSITGGKLVSGSTGGYFLIAAPRRDYTITADLTLVTGGTIRFLLRHADSNNHLLLEVGPTSMLLYKRQGNVLTALVSSVNPGITSGVMKTISVTLSGRSISATINGATVSTNLSAYDQALFLSPTTVGVYFNGTVTGASVDNLSIAPAALTLDVYNASTPGMAASYSQSRLALQMPLAPDLTVINYGHNETYQDIRIPTLTLIRGVLDFHPRTQVAITAQNPRAASNGAYVDGILKAQSLTALAATEGYGLIDIFTRFNDNATYATDWLNVDGLHPNPTGSTIWADEVQRWLLRTRNMPAPPHRPTRLWIPAQQLFATESTPVMAAVGGLPGLSFDPTTEQAAACVVDVPSSWVAFTLTVLAVTPTNSGLTGSTNTVVWEITWGGTGFDTTAVTAPTSTVVPTQNVSQANMSINNTGAPSVYALRVVSGASVSSRPVSLQVRRRAADAGDTYATAATLLGVAIERVA